MLVDTWEFICCFFVVSDDTVFAGVSLANVNFAQHLIDMHSGPHGADEVNAFMSYPKKSKERDNRIAEIRIRGNHMINMATLQAEQGMFVAMRRPSPQADWKENVTFFYVSRRRRSVSLS